MEINYDKIDDAVKYFSSMKGDIGRFGDKIDPLSILHEILTMITNSYGGEDFESITDTLPRDMMRERLVDRYNKAIKKILSDEFDFADLYEQHFVDELESITPEELEPFDPKRFIKIILDLNKQGHPIYVTNFHAHIDLVWDEYAKYIFRKVP